MTILTERISFDQAGIVVETVQPEKEGLTKSLYLKGIFIQGGVRNFNERIYPARK
jgi:hypothetical protein